MLWAERFYLLRHPEAGSEPQTQRKSTFGSHLLLQNVSYSNPWQLLLLGSWLIEYRGTGMWRCMRLRGQRQKTNAYLPLALFYLFWNIGFLIASCNLRVLKRSSQRQYSVSPKRQYFFFFFLLCGEFSNYNTFIVARNNPKLIIALQIVHDVCSLRNYLVRGYVWLIRTKLTFGEFRVWWITSSKLFHGWGPLCLWDEDKQGPLA